MFSQDRAVGQLAHDHKWEVEGSSPSLATQCFLLQQKTRWRNKDKIIIVAAM